MTIDEKAEQLVGYIQERCLWQFFSRSWDREDNIKGIMSKALEMLTGEKSSLETSADKCYHADAKIMVADFKSKFPWFKETPREEFAPILKKVEDRMLGIVVKGSRNEELNVENY